MNKPTKFILCSLAVAGIAAMVSADEPKKTTAKSGILHPEMTVAEGAGTYAKPAGQMGEKPSEPWSATTVGAAVDKKPEPGRVVTVTGEIIDLSCYLQVGKHGEKHKSCGVKCLQNSQPIGLLTRTGTVYMLMEEEHDPRRDAQTGFRQAAIDNFAKIMEVTGTEASLGSAYRAIYVHGYVKK